MAIEKSRNTQVEIVTKSHIHAFSRLSHMRHTDTYGIFMNNKNFWLYFDSTAIESITKCHMKQLQNRNRKATSSQLSMRYERVI